MDEEEVQVVGDVIQVVEDAMVLVYEIFGSTEAWFADEG